MVHIPSVAPMDASLLTIRETTTPSSLPDSSSLVFGQTFSDHMLQVPWSLEKGWGAPEIKSYGPIEVSPAATVLHYASTLFEGLKVSVPLRCRERCVDPVKIAGLQGQGWANASFPSRDEYAPHASRRSAHGFPRTSYRRLFPRQVLTLERVDL